MRLGLHSSNGVQIWFPKETVCTFIRLIPRIRLKTAPAVVRNHQRNFHWRLGLSTAVIADSRLTEITTPQLILFTGLLKPFVENGELAMMDIDVKSENIDTLIQEMSKGYLLYLKAR